MFFSSNTPHNTRSAICRELRTTYTGDLGNYLGLPPIIGRGKKQAFMEVKQKIAKKLQGWKGKLLSQAGREILIKSVAQAIPVYTMSCFRIPDNLCTEINSMVSKFWWGQKNTEHKIHWQEWSKLCRDKSEGGMGFRDLSLFNQALLAKQGWRLMQQPNSLLHKVLKAKYFPDCTFMEAAVPSHSSYTWRSIAQARHVIRLGTRWRIGSGSKVNIWRDHWVGSSPPFTIFSQRQILPETATVSALIDSEVRQWKFPLIDTIFMPEEAERIKAVPLLPPHKDDIPVWRGTSHGRFTTQSAYKIQLRELQNKSGAPSNPRRSNIFWKKLWGADVPNKIKTFMWRTCNSILPTKTKLFQRGIVASSSCPVCHDEAETEKHILWECDFAREAWTNSSLEFLCQRTDTASWNDLVELVLLQKSKPDIELFFTMAWRIWANRNATWQNNPQLNAKTLGTYASTYVEEYMEANKKLETSLSTVKRHWEPPTEPMFKMNVAWQSFNTRHSKGVGAVIRDHSGSIMAAFCEEFPSSGADLPMVALALSKAMQFGLEVGFQMLVEEFTDSQIGALLTSKEDCFIELDEMLTQLRALQPEFSQLSYHLVPHSRNKAAKTMVGYCGFIFLVRRGPVFLLLIVIADLSF